jgi:hypothetical protein
MFMGAMQYYHLNEKLAVLIFWVPNLSGELEVLEMPSMLKSTVLSVGLLAATALAAQAQSVSSLPPGGGAPQSAVTQPATSPKLVGLTPGATSTPTAEHYQPPADTASNPADHPYSAAVDKADQGLKPN